MRILLFLSFALALCSITAEEITPYKFKDGKDLEQNYLVPSSSRFTVARNNESDPNITYYCTKPEKSSYPIAIFCTGSSNKKLLYSIIHLHRYFLQELLNLNCAVVTVEQWGIDENSINQEDFFSHYTRSQRLQDHQTVINFFLSNPPEGWNGKFIFLGVSEGGPIVLTLAQEYPNDTLATVCWSGAGDDSWLDELWVFIEKLKPTFPWWIKLWSYVPKSFPFALDVPHSKEEYENIMMATLNNPTDKKNFFNMTYLYHADALTYQKDDYEKLTTPLLIVTGAKDSIIESSDRFVEKAKQAQCPVTYLRVEDMDHYVRKRPDILEQSFAWLKNVT